MGFPSIVCPSFRGISHLTVGELRDLYLTLVNVSWTLGVSSIHSADGLDRFKVHYLVEIRERGQVGKDGQEVCWCMFHMG